MSELMISINPTEKGWVISYTENSKSMSHLFEYDKFDEAKIFIENLRNKFGRLVIQSISQYRWINKQERELRYIARGKGR